MLTRSYRLYARLILVFAVSLSGCNNQVDENHLQSEEPPLEQSDAKVNDVAAPQGGLVIFNRIGFKGQAGEYEKGQHDLELQTQGDGETSELSLKPKSVRLAQGVQAYFCSAAMNEIPTEGDLAYERCVLITKSTPELSVHIEPASVRSIFVSDYGFEDEGFIPQPEETPESMNALIADLIKQVQPKACKGHRDFRDWEPRQLQTGCSRLKSAPRFCCMHGKPRLGGITCKSGKKVKRSCPLGYNDRYTLRCRKSCTSKDNQSGLLFCVENKPIDSWVRCGVKGFAANEEICKERISGLAIDSIVNFGSLLIPGGRLLSNAKQASTAATRLARSGKTLGRGVRDALRKGLAKDLLEEAGQELAASAVMTAIFSAMDESEGNWDSDIFKEMLDPTGIASLLSQYKLPDCNQIIDYTRIDVFEYQASEFETTLYPLLKDESLPDANDQPESLGLAQMCLNRPTKDYGQFQYVQSEGESGGMRDFLDPKNKVQVAIDEDGLFYMVENQKPASQHCKNCKFTMTKDGRIFIIPQGMGISHGGMMSRNPVAAAGLIKFALDGRVLEIKNKAPGYNPSVESIQNLLTQISRFATKPQKIKITTYDIGVKGASGDTSFDSGRVLIPGIYNGLAASYGLTVKRLLHDEVIDSPFDDVLMEKNNVVKDWVTAINERNAELNQNSPQNLKKVLKSLKNTPENSAFKSQILKRLKLAKEAREKAWQTYQSWLSNEKLKAGGKNKAAQLRELNENILSQILEHQVRNKNLVKETLDSYRKRGLDSNFKGLWSRFSKRSPRVR